MTTQTHADKIPIVRFNPNQDGLARWFGPLETVIMDIMWSDGRPRTIKDVHRIILCDRELAYTTVMTTMARLAEKGILVREKDGWAYTYTVACSQADFEAAQIRAVVESIGQHEIKDILGIVVARQKDTTI